ncbi:MAG TPA: histidine ammonia-lyase [Candidatus Thermoplasmatota archaeon]|nr:histidine ammonia-lyase [Candidatus Thermoplasmatota archaeon]
MAETVVLDGSRLTLDAIVAVAREGAKATVAAKAWKAVARSRAIVDALVARGEVAYGITTGFGEFAQVTIEPAQVRQLQRNLLMSHAVGVGDPLPRDVVRAMMLIRANTLVKGHSGVRRLLVERILDLLAADLVPVVPSRGSVGSSGDLCPLAHMALPLIGLGQLQALDGKPVAAAKALKEAGLAPLVLEAKEGLALINGTQMMSAIGALAVRDALGLLQDAQAVAGMSVEALMGSVAPFDERVHALRPHRGQAAVASNLRALTAKSGIVHSHEGCDRVQDAYSLRCIPQVLGPVHDVLSAARAAIEVEVNSVTDNPLVFPDGTILSQGNFHGEVLAFHLDFLAIALSEVASLSERRTERLVNPQLSEGLKPFLVDSGGLNSGFMIAQYAAAALVSENKVLSHPASVDSIPTSANQEDHNSMGSIAALKLLQVLRNARAVVAIEALCAAQAIDFKAPLKPGVGSAAAHKAIRAVIPKLDRDRILSDDIATMERLLVAGTLREAMVKAGVKLA